MKLCTYARSGHRSLALSTPKASCSSFPGMVLAPAPMPSLEVAATRAPTATIATSSLTLCGREACTANTNVTTPPKMAMGRSG
eukprot:CAMPEP_0115760644 /NCGR_PEP_ID=MMETSP0272-20121206/100105_1 /TAXON_ID=71861 /ORGANISM="Scrippsiella trochoidea, Strain CCMP3099" /LENGTH=82 /DNA_ID=CAMNT_0003206315 /DNA_START=316 /DNA_END=561 /DNA_ORIENTATION=-